MRLSQFSIPLVLLPFALGAQQSLTVQRIFGTNEFAVRTPSLRWMRDGRSVLEIRRDSTGGSRLERVDLVTGASTVLADAAMLTPPGGTPLAVEDAQLSSDETKVLLFHSSVRMWRTNTRGVYHVLDLTTKQLVPLAPDEPGGSPRADASSLQMFARFSPSGTHVAFVRGNNLWVKDLTTGRVSPLTQDGSDDIINGTSDWVYEEELGLRDAFRWSPDGRRIAYWRFDQHEVGRYPLVDELTPYPRVSVVRYPKAGQANARVRVGVVSVDGGPTQWMSIGPDSGSYITAMEWVDTDSLAIRRLPRRQDRADVLMLSATSGEGRSMEIDRDSAYVEAGGNGLTWLKSGAEFLSLNDRTGWRQLFLIARSGAVVRQVTTDGADVLDVLAVDEAKDMVYVAVASPTPTQRQVFRFSIHGGKKAQVGGVRVLSAPGSHRLSVGPTGQWAVDIHSQLGHPPTATLFEFPVMRRFRTLEDNASVEQAMVAARLHEPEFFRVPLPNGIELDAYRIVPASFDSTRRYPVLMYAYGGPAAPQVLDQWNGPRYLWHQLLAERGYVVVVVDNRGAAWRGREFRKMTEGRLGLVESDDQIAAARWLSTRPWVDAARIGFWGWSFGGFLTTMSLARGGDVFKAGIAVAPVTDWHLYDSIYTERYMRTPSDNPDGYAATSPQRLIGGLRAKLLLVHGTGDDNVHPQNSTQLVEQLIQAGKPFNLMLYPNRTHGISDANASVHLFETMTAFILANL